MAIELKEVNISNGYAAEFFTALATKPEGSFFVYEGPATATSVRSAAYSYGSRLGKKFTVRVLPPESEGGASVFAVGVTGKVTKRRGRKPRSASQTTPETPETNS